METEKQENARRHRARRARLRERSAAHPELRFCCSCGKAGASGSFRNCDRCREIARKCRAGYLARGLCSECGADKPSHANALFPACFERRLLTTGRTRAPAKRPRTRGLLLLDHGLDRLAPEMQGRQFATVRKAVDPLLGSPRKRRVSAAVVTRRPKYWMEVAAALRCGIVGVAALSNEAVVPALDWYWVKLHLRNRANFLLQVKQGSEHYLTALDFAGSGAANGTADISLSQ